MTEPNYTRLEASVKAQAVLENKAFHDAFELVRKSLIDGLEALPLNHPDAARASEDFRMCLKLLKSVKAALETAVRSGKVEQSFISEIEAYRKNPRKGIFR